MGALVLYALWLFLSRRLRQAAAGCFYPKAAANASVFTLCFCKPLELSDFFCHRAIVFGGSSVQLATMLTTVLEDLLHGLPTPQVSCTLKGNHLSTRYCKRYALPEAR